MLEVEKEKYFGTDPSDRGYYSGIYYSDELENNFIKTKDSTYFRGSNVWVGHNYKK